MTSSDRPDPVPVAPVQEIPDPGVSTKARLRVASVWIAFAVLTILFGRVVWIGLGRGKKAVRLKGS